MSRKLGIFFSLMLISLDPCLPVHAQSNATLILVAPFENADDFTGEPVLSITEIAQIVTKGVSNIEVVFLDEPIQTQREAEQLARRREARLVGDGNTRYTTEINGRELIMLSGRSGGGDDAPSAPRGRAQRAAPAAEGKPESIEDFPEALDEEEDDLPF